jgi:hypothetical protein
MGSYRQQLEKNTGDMNTALQNVQVDGLKGLEDGLTGIISGTESVSSAFKKMAASILADLARIAVEKTILSVIGLGGLSTGGTVAGVSIGGRRDGGLLGYARGGIPGFAGGTRLSTGMISGPGTSHQRQRAGAGGRQGADPRLQRRGHRQRTGGEKLLADDRRHEPGHLPKLPPAACFGAMASLAYPRSPAQSLRAPGQTVIQQFTIDAKGARLANELMAR